MNYMRINSKLHQSKKLVRLDGILSKHIDANKLVTYLEHSPKTTQHQTIQVR